MQYKTLLFDLDGTLTDPREGITRCVQYALARQDIRVDDLSRLECFIGPPLKSAFMEFYNMNHRAAEQAVEDYRERFGRIGLYENALYDGMHRLLAELQASGRQLFVATSKPWVFARQIIRHFRLEPYFGQVYGSELSGERSEKHALIAYILREEHLRPATTLMIGDRRFDLAGARHNGVAAAAVGYGFGSRTELLGEQPDHFFDTPAELRAFLMNTTTKRDRLHAKQLQGGVLR